MESLKIGAFDLQTKTNSQDGDEGNTACLEHFNNDSFYGALRHKIKDEVKIAIYDQLNNLNPIIDNTHNKKYR